MDDNKIPLGVLTPKPKAKLDLPPAPSEERLRLLLANDCIDAAQELIEVHELPFKIVDGQLVDSLEGTDLWLRKFITEDADCIEMKLDIVKLSKTEDEVLIVGATGTGKELLARALIGNRAGKSVAINCAGLPDNLIESELFGHVRGAFTGAESDKQGLMAYAKDGLCFLDEIGELPLSVQGKLLRAIQDRKIRRVGSNKEEEISCKIVFATNKDIRQMTVNGFFRQDLYARISTFELHVKSLDKRKCDIEPITLSLHKGKEFFEVHGDKLMNGQLTLQHNVRSLQQYVKRWNVLGRI